MNLSFKMLNIINSQTSFVVSKPIDDICASHSNVDFYIILLSHNHPIAGFTVDFTSYADEWPRGLLRLDNQTRSNADARTIIWNNCTSLFRRRFLSHICGNRHPETVTASHFLRWSGGHSIFNRFTTAI